MQLDARLSRTLHLLIHLARADGPITSEEAARMLGTHAVVVRRDMAGLREAGHVQSVKGHGGGWTLSRPLDQISMLDIYEALGEPRLFSLGPATVAPDCLVEQAVNASMATALDDARVLLLTHLRGVSLADIAADFDKRLCERS
ncbi:Rrf2 family transcriptional regulator [Sphingobium nicotianae]|uniref:Rrf2 family transcriptional regulator n=1 Tax=Sphingobium nicotianae TaxID=2782607 RepID=A0A9X1IRZ6_9SPHN|nr:Rrf2 family transcriptional regulator [Sphingobium nicotianae]MBT2187933.1 Rrf2 family transcriptional regulator [Sphingobium nicotianae]